ncbi:MULTISPECIES: lipopolysaccharide assembly protein LapB [Streptacidiphilus]|uniref:Tetratricopeptide repeat protein n=1 Tax=Streptacidiphilus cavernicola TaxID=3342716 RepID=A0ABV6UK80_9ACTN|nr:tetratricopeptide repeat protein [Streptacidiphilus jeojiense]
MEQQPGPEAGDLHSGHAECGPTGPERLEAEGEVAVARLVMDGGDLRHAASHLGFAVAVDPVLPEAHEALTELAVRAGGAEAAVELFPMDPPYTGAVACRSHLYAACGRWADALGLLASVMRVEPSLPWAQVAWMARPDLVELIDAEVGYQAVARYVGGGLPDPMPPQLQEAARPFYALVQVLVERNPQEAKLQAIASGLARRYQDHERAVAWAQKAVRIDPGHMSRLMLGYALRAAGRPREALAVWEEQLRADSSDDYLHVDVAETYADLGEPEAGLPWLERVLESNPDHPKAAPTHRALRFRIDADPAHLLALADHARVHPDHTHASTILARLSRNQAWLSGVPSATEAVVNILHQFLADPANDATHTIQIASSMVEPPSSVLAFLTAFPKSTVMVKETGDPDPRLPQYQDGTEIWAYDGLRARPALAPPRPETTELVRRVAEISWPSLPAAYDHAAALVALPLEDLLGILAHPPVPRDDQQGALLRGKAPDLWIRAVQSFACLGIAHHRTEQPWTESDRRRVLVDLLFGAEDWVNEAAGFALVTAAWMDPDIRPEVGHMVVDRFLSCAKAYQTREVTILGSLSRLVLLCPWLDRKFTGLANDMLKAIERNDAQVPEDKAEREQEMVEMAKSAAPGAIADSTPTKGQAPASSRRWPFGRRRR